jgi:hypothetical protein
MNRRRFLQVLGVFAASAALPVPFATAKVAKAPSWAKTVLRFGCAPLDAGSYTFSAYAFGAVRNVQIFDRALSNEELIAVTCCEYRGLYVAGVKAEGGETVIEIPWSGENLKHPRIIEGGIVAPLGPIDLWHPQLERGQPVTSYILPKEG